MTTQLCIFTKFWEPGHVKTRLAQSIGDVWASTVYREFVSTLLERFGGKADRCVLVYAPADRGDAFRAFAGPAWELMPQSAGDLGTRMAHVLEQSTGDPRTRVLLIGSDSPNLPAGEIASAFRRLEQHQVVLGPTTDGGYYLVGARGMVPPIFDGVPWSTPGVWPQTVARLDEHRIAYSTLRSWYDVDQIEDLRRLDEELEAGGPALEFRSLARVVRQALESSRPSA